MASWASTDRVAGPPAGPFSGEPLPESLVVGSIAVGLAFGIPEVIVEEHLAAEPATIGRLTRMGFDHGPEDVIATMEEQLR